MTEQDKKLCKAVINTWIKTHPSEIAEFYMAKEELKKRQTDKYASRGQGMRHALEVPTDLARKLEKLFPLVFKDKDNLHWFMREFPVFCIPDAV